MLKLRSLSVTSRMACLIAAVLACAAATTPAAMAGALADGGSIAIRAGRIYPASPDLPAMIENGVIVIRDGRIEAIGADIDPPADLPLVEYPDASITPGLVAVSAEVAGEHRGLDSVGAGFWALDAFDRYADWRPMLASGVTTAHLSPGSNKLLSGRGAVVRFAAHDDPHAVLLPMSDLTVNLHEGVYNPPSLVEALIPPSADNLIEPGRPQRPDSRIGLYVALKDAVESALSSSDRSLHQSALASAWTEGAPIRIHADRAADLLGATTFLQTNDRRGYLVGGAESARIAERLRDAGYPLVYGLDASFRAPGNDLGASRDAVERNVRDLAALDGLKLALTVAPGGRAQDLRLAASTAQRSGMDAHRVLESVTRIPAEILGVDDHVGSLAPGKLADLVLHSGDPLETRSHVLGVYLSGTPMFRAPNSDAVVVRAGTVWLGPAPSEVASPSPAPSSGLWAVPAELAAPSPSRE
ncbi:MAG: amidohydrolase family protein, partial [Planctomycetota bacterium]